jgi:hypothetical protein
MGAVHYTERGVARYIRWLHMRGDLVAVPNTERGELGTLGGYI